MEKTKSPSLMSETDLARLLSKNLKKKVEPKKESKQELDLIIKKILSTTQPKKQEKKRVLEEHSIEEKVDERALEESQKRMIESTDFWQEHKKKHKGAEITIFNHGTRFSSESLQSSLPSKGGATYVAQEMGGISYGPGPSAMPTTGGEGVSYMGANDPSRPGFWLTCNCGMTMEVQGGAHAGSAPEIKSYGVSAAATKLDSVYGATNQFNVSYNPSQATVGATYQ
jgi:hypothetical protein